MMKRLAVACAFALALIGHAYAVGSISLSGSQQLNSQGKPLSGGLFYTFQSGTTTPQSAFQDQALTIPYPNPITLDASGRIPFFYLADGNIKIRLTDSTGVTVIAADGLLVIGPSSGGGGGGSVDPTTILATGDVKTRYGTGSLSGFVRMNGRTLGSASSGATERANADAQALFEYLWTNDANLVVSGGRGATANADWLANKTITLPDARGKTIFGADDMGNSAAGVLTSPFFGASGTTLGAKGGQQNRQIVQSNVPSYFLSIAGLSISVPGITSSVTDPTHSHGVTDPTHAHGISPTATQASGTTFQTGGTGGAAQAGASSTQAAATGISIIGAATGISVTSSLNSAPLLGGNLPSGGSDIAFPIVPPGIVMTTYIKL